MQETRTNGTFLESSLLILEDWNSKNQVQNRMFSLSKRDFKHKQVINKILFWGFFDRVFSCKNGEVIYDQNVGVFFGPACVLCFQEHSSQRIFIAVPERWIALDCAGVVCVHPTFSSVPVLLVQLISLDFSQVYALVYYWDQFQKKSCYACKFLCERIKSRNKRHNQKWVNKRGRETRKQWGRSIGKCFFFPP